MSGLLNIGGDIDDPTYRYKMPRLQIKVEGRGNGIKTVIPNMIDVARSLHRPPSYPTKFFGCELGAQSKYDDKTSLAVVNGCHDAGKLASLLQTFIEKFVLCPTCKLPEADLEIDRKECISLNCKACGNTAMVDMRHKLTTFILNNPPENGGKRKKEKTDKVKKLKEDKDENDSSGESSATAPMSARSTKGTEKVEKPKKLKKKKDDEEEDDDVEWSTDFSEEAVAARRMEAMASLTAKASELIVEDLPPTPSPRAVGTPLSTNGKGGSSGKLKTPRTLADVDEVEETGTPRRSAKNKKNKESNALTVEAIREYAEKHTPAEVAVYLEKKASDGKEAVRMLVDAMFGSDIGAVMKTKIIPLLKKVVASSDDQREILGGLERLAGREASVLQGNTVANALKWMYDADLLEEEIVLKWGAANSKEPAGPKVREKAKPFLDWLQNASEVGEEDDDDEEDDD
mmetsp:Transcript_13481/g.22136  ORF Transcript_13481/g.22136 Transcript_13481/m.22136 type:complete len:458 (+) Transcript_13481:287-1660(+)|eukprot:CAMPEP_0184650228 /NCGR_PEP_ID=MMETSP0308-20130426/7749_1 /TAXON_ID=38269 /ORGANISM="Gloeochaete witrockiana, Strain SAG 46.84" /LENGTH=457 /DNA_ID=CAMNT_0027083609 /DNA_START=256 /DNA_END=1629 /DNA_ORIENTATION=-